MGRKNVKKNNHQPNAPEFQQILLESNVSRQPAHNPYYPDLEVGSALLPPPPYSDLSISTSDHHRHQTNQFVPTTTMGHSIPRSGAGTNYARFSNQSAPGAPPATVIVQQQPLYMNRKFELKQRKVRKFNNEMLLVALFAIGLSVYAHHLYSQRTCVNFLVHAPVKDVSITINNVRDMHLFVAYGSIFILILCLAKCAGGDSHSHSCYLLLMTLTTFMGTLFTGYLAYLAFYSPCSLKASELISNTLKTIVGSMADTLPAPDKRVFGESNVIDLAREDAPGVWIFFIDVFNFILYLSGFISAFVLC